MFHMKGFIFRKSLNNKAHDQNGVVCVQYTNMFMKIHTKHSMTW